MNLFWDHRDDVWHLTPRPAPDYFVPDITVRQLDGFWRIFVESLPTNLPYTSEQGAKNDAWQLAYSQRRALFETSVLDLVDTRSIVS